MGEIPLDAYNLKSSFGRAMLRLETAKDERAAGHISMASLSELQAVGEIFNDSTLGTIKAGQYNAIIENLPDDLKAPIKARLEAVKATK